MENKGRLLFTQHKGAPLEKNSNLLQIIIIISSSILSSSAIATVVKAWLDNRKTKLTIDIYGDRKTLKYEGYYLDQDAPAIQTIVDMLSEDAKITSSANTVTIDLTYDGQKEEYMLASRNQPSNPTDDQSEQTVTIQPSSPLKRLLPGWLHK